MSGLDDIVLTPDPRLSQTCRPISEVDDVVRELALRMLRDMYDAEGCGLAAPQIGELVRLVVIDVDYVDKDAERNPYVLINPRIVAADGPLRSFSEGCLSFPGISVPVERPSHVVVQALDLDENLIQYEAENNLLAVCLQHEIDHLDGITMLDHVSPTQRLEALRACADAVAAGARPGQTTSNNA